MRLLLSNNSFGYILLFSTLLMSCEEQMTEDIEPRAKEARVTGVTVITMPFTDNGSPWDFGSGADVSFAIATNSTVLYDYQSYFDNTYNDSLPLIFSLTTAYLLPQVDQQYTIQLYDYDSVDPNDPISSISFNPYDYSQEKPESKLFTTPTTQLKVFFKWD